MKRLLPPLLLLSLCCAVKAQVPNFGAPMVPNSSGVANNLIPVNSNQTLYVATTGNDNNACTISAKCATITHVMALLKTYDFQYTYTATVNVADGTYTGTVTLPALYHYPGPIVLNGTHPEQSTGMPVLVGDATTPANAVIQSASGDALNTEGYGAPWVINGFRLKSTTGTNADLDCFGYCYVAINNIDFAGSGILVSATNFSLIFAVASTLTSSTSSATIAINATVGGWFINDGGTWTINNSPTFSSEFANVGDRGVLGHGTYVNGGTVTGPKFTLYNYGLIEFASAQSSFPGSTAGTLNTMSTFQGDNTVSLGAADFNITSAGDWTFSPTAGLLTISSGNLTFTGFALNNTSTGGHDVFFVTGGSSGLFGIGAGQSGLIDATNGNVVFWNDASGNVTHVGVLGWSALNAYSATAADTGLSRVSAGLVAVGNGAAGDHSGTIQATHFTSGTTAGVTCSGTPTSSFASVNGIVTHC